VVENKDSLLKPILSRFCDIYVPDPIINGVPTNLHRFFIDTKNNVDTTQEDRIKSLEQRITIHSYYTENTDDESDNTDETQDNKCNIARMSRDLYEQGYSALDIIEFVHKSPMNEMKKYELLIIFDKVRREFRNEKLLILFLIHFIVFRCKMSLENISFM
jgi:hypothetical protein